MFKMSYSQKFFNSTNYLLLMVICLFTIYPFWYVFMYSISDGVKSAAQPVTFYPLSATFENYRAVFVNSGIMRAFFISVSRTVIGASLHLLVTALAAYALSQRELVGKKKIMTFFIIPMYFSGGLLPYYVLISKMHLTDNFLVYILPLLFNGFHMLLMKVFFEQLPIGLQEAARIDGATDLQVFLKVILPSSKPIIATIGLFIGVMQWNSWFDAFLFVNKADLYPLQTILQKLILESQTNSILDIMEKLQQNSNVSSEALKMATVIVATVPILIVYPFLQKYFVKGMLLGAVKE